MVVYEAIGETLKRLEVRATFGLMGDGNLRFMTHLAHELGMPYYAARHECGAVAMADGYARVTGRVGVCSVTQGPGVTNTLTALTEARKASTPMLLLAGDTASRILRHNQDVDQTAIFKSVGVTVARVRAPDTLVIDLSRAFNQALALQQPIAISIPTDMQVLPCDTDALQALVVQAPMPSRPSPEEIRRAVDLIAASKRPAIIAGRGAVRSNAREPLERLAEQIGALLATTAQAKGLFAGHPFYVGSSGGFAWDLGERLLPQADLILAFGASLNYWTTRNRDLFASSARILQCDRNSAAIGALTSADFGLVGDVAATAEALSKESAQRAFSAGFRTPEIRREIDSFRLDNFQDQSNGRTIDPRTLMLKLDAMLPRHRTVVIDSGHSMGWPIIYLSAPTPPALFFPTTLWPSVWVWERPSAPRSPTPIV
jgi:acetolactate synthase I/II/III large subunit